MNNPSDPRTDIRSDDLLFFRPSPDADNGQIVHYELSDDYGENTCFLRKFRMNGDGIVTLSAQNQAIDPVSGERVYPDIVLPRDRVQIRGIWTRIFQRGVRI